MGGSAILFTLGGLEAKSRTRGENAAQDEEGLWQHLWHLMVAWAAVWDVQSPAPSHLARQERVEKVPAHSQAAADPTTLLGQSRAGLPLSPCSLLLESGLWEDEQALT